MKIAILGAGAIGSTFGFHLARSGHEVTVIARGKRLQQLQADQAIVTVDGRRAPVQVCSALAPEAAFDLVLVTVLEGQLAPVLPALQASAARKVMFMFNTFAPLQSFEDAVGASRFAFGFPAILAFVNDGKLRFTVISRGQTTLATDPLWASIFTEAGIRTTVPPDMQSWLRTHAAFVSVLMAMACRVYERRAGVSWAEARDHALAMREGFALVARLGSAVTPKAMAAVAALPLPLLAGSLWAASRLEHLRVLGAIGAQEARALLDSMCAMAPERCTMLRAIRP
jgi:2-dehydropantoate 2-reductase